MTRGRAQGLHPSGNQFPPAAAAPTLPAPSSPRLRQSQRQAAGVCPAGSRCGKELGRKKRPAPVPGGGSPAAGGVTGRPGRPPAPPGPRLPRVPAGRWGVRSPRGRSPGHGSSRGWCRGGNRELPGTPGPTGRAAATGPPRGDPRGSEPKPAGKVTGPQPGTHGGSRSGAEGNQPSAGRAGRAGRAAPAAGKPGGPQPAGACPGCPVGPGQSPPPRAGGSGPGRGRGQHPLPAGS